MRLPLKLIFSDILSATESGQAEWAKAPYEIVYFFRCSLQCFTWRVIQPTQLFSPLSLWQSTPFPLCKSSASCSESLLSTAGGLPCFGTCGEAAYSRGNGLKGTWLISWQPVGRLRQQPHPQPLKYIQSNRLNYTPRVSKFIARYLALVLCEPPSVFLLQILGPFWRCHFNSAFYLWKTLMYLLLPEGP